MSFAGIGFLAGLFGIVLPLAIHLFARRKRVPMPWGAMRFLAEAKPSWRRRTLRLQDWLVLLLRVAAVALLALAFVRPLLETPIQPSDDQHWLVIVDRSPSTELGTSQGNTIADAIHDKAREALTALPEGTRLSFFVNGSDKGLTRLPPANGLAFNHPRNRDSWLETLKTLPPAADTIDWPDAIREALSYPLPADGGGEATPQNGDSKVLIIADAAIHGWPLAQANTETGSATDDEAAALTFAWQSVTADPGSKGQVTVSVLPVGSRHPDRQRANLCVDRIEANPRRASPGEMVTIRARISNRGGGASDAAVARWSVSDLDSAVSEAEVPPLDPGAVHELVLKRSFPHAAFEAVRLEVETDDALAIDNAAGSVIEIVDQLEVIAVTDYAPKRIEDADTRFSHWSLAAATGNPTSTAGTGDESRSVFRLRWLKVNEMADIDLDTVAVVIWSANDRDPAAVANSTEKLHRFVSKGGGLWLRPPRDLAIEAFNAAFFPHEYGLSPAAISRAESPPDPISLRPSQVRIESGLARHALSALGELQAQRHFALNRPLPPSSTVLAEFAGGAPFIVSRRLGRGEVVLTTLDTHPQSGNLAACSGYLPLVRELLWQLAAGQLPDRNLAPGDTETWRQLGVDDSVRTPAGEWISPPQPGNDSLDRPAAATTAIGVEQGSPFNSPGLYLVESASDGKQTPYSVSRIAEESNIRATPESYFRLLKEIDHLEIIDPETDLAETLHPVEEAASPADPNADLKIADDDASPRSAPVREHEITVWLLMALLGFLVIELISAQHLLSRRRKASGRRPLSARRANLG